MGLQDMRGLSIFALVAMFATPCLAQDGPDNGQCEQVRAAVEQYGLQAARKHATENYGLTPADLRRVEQDCGIDKRNRRPKKEVSG